MSDLSNRILNLPALPMRGVSVFPGSAFHFDVERSGSLAGLNAAIGSDRLIFLVSQRDMTVEIPHEEDLYTVGTICRISQMLRSHTGGSAKCIVDGLYRARLLRVTTEEPCLWVNVQVVSDFPCDASRPEVAAEMRACNDLFNEYASVSGNVGPETLLRLAASSEPGFISDYISQNIYLRPEDKQKLLEQFVPLKRLRLLNSLLRHELEILDIQQDLQYTTVENMNKHQKEYYLREQMSIIREELGENPEADDEDTYREKIKTLGLDEANEKKLLKELDRMMKQPYGSQEGAMLQAYLDTVLELPWNVKTPDCKDISRAEKILNEDHYGLKKVKERVLEFLAVRAHSDKLKGGVLCLVGPPGVGKTSIAISVARATNRKLARLSLGGVHDEAEIRGHRKTYVGAMPGRIIEGIRMAGSQNPVLVLDEIDKLGSDYRGDPSAALLEALDAEQNGSFRDHFLEIPFDLSEVLFITTANTLDTVPRPLLDRMEIIEMGSYTDEEKLHIAKDYLLPKQRKKHGLDGRQLRLSDDCLRQIISDYTREAGVRLLEREISSICRKTCMGIESGCFKSLRLNKGQLEPILGVPKYKDETIVKENKVGLVHGLAWTYAGGELLDVECAAVPGSGKIELTGNLGDVMKESCKAAVTYIRSRCELLNIDPEFYKNTDLHLHFPEGAVPKDGPSAGIAICLALISALSRVPVRGDYAMTGEITLQGRVLPIGGIQEKSMGALRAGVLNVILPEKNVCDLKEIDEDVRSRLQYHSVSSMDDVVSLALCAIPEKMEEPFTPEKAKKARKSTGKTAVRQ